MTYFPINIILLPFLLFIILMKSERLNNFILQIQYFFLIICYCSVALVMVIPVIPLLYLKMIIN